MFRQNRATDRRKSQKDRVAMELKKLQYLESVYRLKSLTQAAAEQYISQPSMTKAIRSLESELDIQLVRRTNTGIQFTFQGELLMRHVYRILNDVEHAKAEMRDLHDNQSKTLLMCVSNIDAPWILPMTFEEFVPREPGCIVDVRECTLTDMIESLLSEKIDIAFTIFPDSIPEDLLKIHLVRPELHLVMPNTHRLAQYSRIPIHELDVETLLTYQKGSIIRDTLDLKCLECGAAPLIQVPSVQRSIIYHLVSLGAGLTNTLVSPMQLEKLDPSLTTRGFEEPIYFNEGFLYNKNHYLNKTVRSFIQFMRNKYS